MQHSARAELFANSASHSGNHGRRMNKTAVALAAITVTPDTPGDVPEQ
jgi:hypothetical protein